MALYTVENVIDATKRLIEEAGDVHVVTQDQLIQMTLDAEKKVATETQCLKHYEEVSLSTSAVSYVLTGDDFATKSPSSIIDVLYYYPHGMKSVRRIEPGKVPPTSDQLYPYYWYFRASLLWLFPWLSAVPAAGTHSCNKVTVVYAHLPTTTAALESDLQIPDDFQIIVPYYVAKLVAVKDNQMNKSQELDKIIQALSIKGITAISGQSAYGGGGEGGQAG